MWVWLHGGIYFLVFLQLCYGQAIRNYQIQVMSENIYPNLTGRCNARAQDRRFQTIAIDRGSLYVGGTNAIFQLSLSNLSLSSTFVTGPDYVINECPDPPFCDTEIPCLGSQRCKNNFNKILIPYKDQLLACGTVYGRCDLLSLNNLTSLYSQSSALKCNRNIANQRVQISTLILAESIAGAIHVNNDADGEDFLYLARTRNGIKTLFTPTRINPYFTIFDDSTLYLYDSVIKDTNNTYHLVWTTSDYTFVVWTEISGRVMLARYCNRAFYSLERPVNEDFPQTYGKSSYTQIELQCPPSGSPEERVVEAKVFSGKLYVLISAGQQTRLCSSSLTDINDKITNARQTCFNSTRANHSVVGLPVSRKSFTCSSITGYEEEWSTCSFPNTFLSFLSPLADLDPLHLSQELRLDTPIGPRAFIVAGENNLLAAFIGTTAGNIFKVALGKENSILSETIIHNSFPSSVQSVIMEESGEHLFAITRDAILKAAVADCENQYLSCSTCLKSRDPYCGWCFEQNRCTRKHSCGLSDQMDKWIGPNQEVNFCFAFPTTQPDTTTFTGNAARPIHAVATGIFSTSYSYSIILIVCAICL